MLEAEARGDGVALGKEIGSNDLGAGAKAERGMHEADGALADDENRVVGSEAEHLDAFENGVDRLDEGGLLEGDAVGNADHAAIGDDEVHDADVLGKAAAGGLEARRDAGLLVERALRGGSLAAVVALVAGDVVMHDNALAEFELCDAGAAADDGAGTSRGRRCGAPNASRSGPFSGQCRRCRRWRS